MKKLLICLLLVGCAGSFKPEYSVNSRYNNSYLASVAMCDQTGEAIGAGTVLEHKNGKSIKIVTAAHVVISMAEKDMLMFSCFSYKNEKELVVPVKIDIIHDLAIVKTVNVAKGNGPHAILAEEEPKIGDNIFVIGSPMGRVFNITTGIVSNRLKIGEKTGYRTDAAAFFGNSGGGVFNNSGEIIGVLVGGETIFGVIAVPGGAFAVALPHIRELLK